MKLYKLCVLVFVLLSCDVIKGADLAQTKNNSDKEEFAQGEREKVKELLKKFSEIASSLNLEVEVNVHDGKWQWFARPMRQQTGNEENRAKHMAEKVSLAASYATVLFGTALFMHAPTGFWDLFVKVFCVLFVTSCAGGLLSWVYEPFARLLVDFYYSFSDDECCDSHKIKKILGKFLKDWPQYKQHTPASLHEMFDDLHEKYVRQGKQLELTAQEIQQVIIIFFSTIILDQKIEAITAVERQPV